MDTCMVQHDFQLSVIFRKLKKSKLATLLMLELLKQNQIVIFLSATFERNAFVADLQNQLDLSC